jgi:heptosyltransferase I
VAAAVGTPIVGLFGPTRPQRNGPWSPTDVSVSRDGTCRCHHLRRCRLEIMCLMDVQVEDVVQAVEERLARGVSRV